MTRRLLTTGELVRELDGLVTGRSISRYVERGWLVPTEITPGGHYRWDVDDVRRQLRAQRQRDE